MDTKINIENFIEYSREVLLQIFNLISKVYSDLKDKDDISGMEKIDNEVIPIYEKIFLSLDKDEVLKLYNDDIEKFNDLEKNIKNIAKDYKFTKSFIEKQIIKRKKMKGNSGSEVVEKFFKYKIKELKNIKGIFLTKMNQLLSDEEKLNFEITNSIQEEEQVKLLEKIIEVSKEYRNLNESLEKYILELNETENKLEKKWYYEIYGTVEKDTLLEVYKSAN